MSALLLSGIAAMAFTALILSLALRDLSALAEQLNADRANEYRLTPDLRRECPQWLRRAGS